MNIIRASKVARPGWIGTAVAILLLAFSATLSAQDKKPPKPPAPTHSAPSHSAPPSRSAPAAQPHASTPQTGTPQTHQGGNSNPTPSGNRTGSTVVSPNNRPAGNTAPASNNGNSRPGSTTVYPNNRPGGNTTPASNNGNNRPGSTTTYSPNTRPGGNNAPPNNGNNRPGGNTVGGGNRGPGTFNANSGNSTSGRTFAPRAAIYHAPNGGQVQTRADGSIREVHTANGAIIHHAPNGVRSVQVQRPGGGVIVANSRGSGYVQRNVVVNNTTFIQRTYVVNNVSYARVYRPWVWGGVSFSVYRPMRFWSPGFYAYAYSPWARPIAYGWGWGGSPWYGYYGGWFTPYPYYAGPAFWLTDYLIAQTLQDAYVARQQAAAAAAADAQSNNYAATPLTPDVKQAIADEVKRQLDQERAEQGSMNTAQAGGPPPIFSGGGPHVFVVANALDVDAGGGQLCPVTEGDVLQLNSPPPSNSQYAQVVVLASKGQDCRKGSTVSVALADLQEMQNQMRATIDQGLGDLQKKQGQGGLPALPASAAGQPTNAPYASQMQPDANAATQLAQVSQDADRAEQDTVNQSMAGGGAPATVALGQSIQDVEAIMGKPKDIADLGSKKIYVYKDLKITFVDGKVTDVQ
ncbi:conserved exported hypothetical protein [Candidatus Sulfopaludibacter sp. SbA4]|nr:conserved exported hypothetical protein [Candidatus Sulfopaludibacter sp. SbA4]